MTVHDEHPIVVAVPTDDDLEAVLHYAAAEARTHQCGLRLVHAHASGDEGHAEVVLGRARAVARLLAGPSVRISTRRVTGSPVQAVLAASSGARLVVVRRRDALNLIRALTVSPTVVGASTPIACVPRDWAPRVRDLRPVLLAIADPADSAAILSRGLAIAREHKASLRLLYAWHLPGTADDFVERNVGPELAESFRSALRAELERCRQVDAFDDVPVELEVRHGIAADLVMQAARDAQVLLLGRNPPAPDGTHRLGRITHAGLHASPCPTVLLPPERHNVDDEREPARLSRGRACAADALRSENRTFGTVRPRVSSTQDIDEDSSTTLARSGTVSRCGPVWG